MMSVRKIAAHEGRLLNFLYAVSPLEWRKFQHRYPEVWVDDHFETVDRSEFPPYVSFRFEGGQDVVVERLRRAVESYSGQVSWMLVGHKRDGLSGTNWTIGPSRLWMVEEQALNMGLTPSQYLAQYDPQFGVVAYGDLEGLSEHIRRAFPEVLDDAR